MKTFEMRNDVVKESLQKQGTLLGTYIADACAEVRMGSVMRLLGFTTLECGCVVGRYKDLSANRDVNYVEEKGSECTAHAHRRNHTIADRIATAPTLAAVKSA